MKSDVDALKVEVPHIVVGTPGRVLDLSNRKSLDLSHVKHFILDECDRLLAEVDMRKTVQGIFKSTPTDKQVMMFSATLDKDVRAICRKFCQDVSYFCMFELNIFLMNAQFIFRHSLWKSSLMMIPS